MKKIHKCILTNICLVYKDDQILVIDRKKKDWPGLKMTCVVGGFIFCGGKCTKQDIYIPKALR